MARRDACACHMRNAVRGVSNNTGGFGLGKVQTVEAHSAVTTLNGGGEKAGETLMNRK